MFRKSRKLVSIALVLCMALSIFGISALADDVPAADEGTLAATDTGTLDPADLKDADGDPVDNTPDETTDDPADVVNPGDGKPDTVVGGTDYTNESAAIDWLNKALSTDEKIPYITVTKADGTTEKITLKEYENNSKKYYLANDTDSDTLAEAQDVIDGNTTKAETGKEVGNQTNAAKVTEALIEQLKTETGFNASGDSILWRVYVYGKNVNIYASDDAGDGSTGTETVENNGKTETVTTDTRETLGYKSNDKGATGTYVSGDASVNDSSFNGGGVPGGSLDVSLESKYEKNKVDVTLVTYDEKSASPDSSKYVLGAQTKLDYDITTFVPDPVTVDNGDGTSTTYTFTGWTKDGANSYVGNWNVVATDNPTPPIIDTGTPSEPGAGTPSEPGIGGDTDIPDESVPEGDAPDGDTDIADEDVPLDDAPDMEQEIPDEEVPLDATPKTGDSDMLLMVILSAMLMASAVSLAALALTRKHN